MIKTVTTISIKSENQKCINAIFKAFRNSAYDCTFMQYGPNVTIDVYTSNREAVEEIYLNAVDKFFETVGT